VTMKLNYTTPTQRLMGGVWFERARHRQTQPAVRVDNNGNIDDLWLGSHQITFNDGTFYQGRDWRTISTGKSVFVQDVIDMMGSRLQVTPGLSYRSIERDFTNFANAGNNAGADYHLDRKYSETLPTLSASFMVTERLQSFIGLTKNFKAPGNFDFANLAQGVTFANGNGTYTSLLPVSVEQETSTTVDGGLRYRAPWGKISATLFVTKFKNRIASAFDPVEALTHDYNVGDSTIKGMEFEAGTVPWHNFSGYVSYTYTDSKIENDMPASATTFSPTGGKQFPDTPKNMAAVSLQWATGPYLANLAAKYTGPRWLTLVNDLKVGGYTLVDLNLAYRVPTASGSVFKNPTIRVNVSNLASKKYFSANSGSGSTIAIAATNNPSVYPGAPRFASVTFQSEF
jgi:iron complex outermembrane recepter protein